MSDTTLIEPGDAIHPGDPPTVERYRLGARVNHWITAVAMVLLVLSGLALYHPWFFFLTVLFGNGQTTRTLHPFIGVILAASFVVLFIQFWRANMWTGSDTAWAKNLGDLVGGREDKMPEQGKFNAGQKFVFWAMAIGILVLFSSGLVIWDRYFFDMTTISSKRIAELVHSLAALGVILVLILHVYAAIWVRGSFHAMLTGKVSAAWAWRHHRKWFRALANKAGPAE